MLQNLSKITKFLSNTAIVVLLTVLSYSFSFVAHADYWATSTATTTGIGSFTVPAGVTSLQVSLTAAGGGGGGGAFTYGGGGGGAGSSIQNIIISVTPGQVIPYTIGIGGVTGSAGSFSIGAGNGGNGGNSTFGTSTAFGGFGGQGAIYGLGNGLGGIAGGIGGTNGTDGASQFGPQRTYGGNGGTTPFGTGGQGAYGDMNTILPAAVAGTNGNGGGGASGWGYSNMSLGLAANTASRGGNGFIRISYYADLTAPVITILGVDPLTLGASSTATYTDAGATAFDNINGTTTVTTIFNNVNLAATGTYFVVYSATDLAGNVAIATRIVDVVAVPDTMAPVITAPGTQIFEATGATTTPLVTYATAIDNVDPSPVITYSPASFGLGTTTVVWTAIDSSGNFSTSTSLVVIRDTTGPAIVLNGSSTMSFIIGTPYVELGASAFDLVDGTTTVTISGSVNVNVVGVYFLIYTSTDLSGNVSNVFRTINVTADTIAPVIVAPVNQTFEATGATTTPALVLATSTDNVTINPAITYAPNSFGLGTTTVLWTAIDSSGNFATTTSLVTIVDTTAPVITLNGSTTVIVLQGNPYNELGATSIDLVNGSVAVSATGTVNTAVAGTYTVIYSAIDLSLNLATTSRTVIVTSSPAVLTTLTIAPLNPTVTVGSSFNFVATTLDQYGNPFVSPVFWGSSNPSVGTINFSSASFNAVSTGTTMITAVSGSLSATTTATVIPVGGSDVTPPTTPVITGVSATGTIITTAVTSWTDSTDGQSGLAGYLYVFDNTAGTVVSTTTPGVATTSATTTSSAIFGTMYFHVAAIDNAGNISGTASYGPLVISDSAVLYRNSTIGGTFYNLFSPSLAQSIVASTTGTTTITNSTLSTFWNVNNSTVTTTTLDNSTLDNSTTTSSTILNSNATNCIILTSSVDGYTLANCYIANSTLDPGAFINSTSTFSTITNSYIYDSVIANSIVGTSTIHASTLSFATVTFSDIATSSITNNSVVTNSVVSLSTLNNAQLSNNSTSTNSIVTNSALNNTSITNSTSTGSILTNTTVASSTLTNVVMASSSITGTVLSNATTSNAVIVNGFINSGTITINGSTYVITVPTLISSLTGAVSGVNLLSTANFAILSQSGITNIPTSAITGDIGTSPAAGSLITGLGCPEVTGVIYTVNAAGPACRIVNPTLLTTAVNDMGTAYADAAGRTNPNATELGAGNIGGMTLTSGLYKWSTNVTIPTDVTLSGSSTAVWIFQISGNLDIASGPSVASGTKVILTGGAQASNVFWQVGGGAGATLGTYSTFNGTILSATQVVVQTGAVLNGRALAQTLVTLDQNIISSGSGTSTPDTTAPVITITGGTPITVVATSTGSYTDAGATALDAVDGVVTASTTFNNVNIAVVGAYSVDYSASDIAGNIATTTRVVNVVATPDTTNPVITIVGANPATVIVGGVYTDAGATANDNVDGNITANIATSSTVNTATIGTYSFDYSVSDGAGNLATSSRVVNVISVPDTTAPVITVMGSNPVTTVVGSAYVDAGATAFDNIDGNITTSIVTTNPVSSTTPVGVYTVTYAVSDIAGNPATSTRTVNVVATPDTTAPVITITGSNPVNIVVGGVYTDAGATANDNIDGNITASIITTNTVNTSVVGPYSVIYNVTDGAGNAATSTRTVNVIATPADTIPPVITMNGGSPLTITLGSVYSDLGATAFDAVDGTTTVTVVNNVNTAATGTYTVDYSSTDIAGNTATTSRIVNVVAAPADNTAPIITITGGTPTSVVQGSVYTDQGATATDNVDPVVTVSATGTVDTSIIGSYSIIYTATDVALNTGTATRTVNVVIATTSDNIAPVITVINGTPITVTVGSVYTDAGATALDNVDGVVAVVTTGTVDTSIVGTYTLTYTATDAALNVGTATRDVNVIVAPADTIPPVITMNGGSPLTITLGSVYSDLGATAFDAVDGTTTVTVVNNVNTAATGTYTVDYSSTDIAGNTATTSRIVNVIGADTVAPVISVLGANPMTIVMTLPYVELGATSIDNIDGNITAGIVITGSVNTSATGTYTIVYTSTDLSGNVASSTRTVNVISDNVAPVITITGANPTTVIVGGAYTDLGATANDNVDGNITAGIVATSTVNTAVIGSYSVTYTVSDTAGNGATSTRIVFVVSGADVTPPAITITGANPASVTIGSVYTDAGATALDAVDGVVVASTTSNNVNTAVIGSYIVVYSATDIALNNSTATRTVNVIAAPVSGGGNSGSSSYGTDIVKPVITILGVNPATTTNGSTYTDLGATATDNVDGNITARITTVNNVNIFTSGTYTVTYMVNDNAGNTTIVIRTVNVVNANNNPAPATTTIPAIPATPAVPATPATPGTPATPATPAVPATPANGNASAASNSNGGNGITIPNGVGQVIGQATTSGVLSASGTASTTDGVNSTSFVATVLESFSNLSKETVAGTALLLAAALLIGFLLYKRNKEEEENNVQF